VEVDEGRGAEFVGRAAKAEVVSEDVIGWIVGTSALCIEYSLNSPIIFQRSTMRPDGFVRGQELFNLELKFFLIEACEINDTEQFADFDITCVSARAP
jgi:hypothetical protein